MKHGLVTSAQLFNAGRNSRHTHSQFLVYRKKSLTFLIFDVGQLIFRDSKAGMVPSTLGMCCYISHSEIVCRGPKKFENPWSRCFKLNTYPHCVSSDSSSPYTFMVWCIIKHKENLTITTDHIGVQLCMHRIDR